RRTRARLRRLGARLLPEVSKSPCRLSQGLLERGELARSRQKLRPNQAVIFVQVTGTLWCEVTESNCKLIIFNCRFSIGLKLLMLQIAAEHEPFATPNN